MEKSYYLAIVEQADGGFGVFFPDLPGCVSGGDTIQEAAANAEAALALHLHGMAEDGEAAPVPSNPADVAPDPDVREVARLMLGGDAAGQKVRVNVMLDAALVAAIDAISDNRSRFLSQAARAKLAEAA